MSNNSQLILVTDTNSLPEQWGASIILGRRKIMELLERNPGPSCVRVGKEANDHVRLKRDSAPVAARQISPSSENGEILDNGNVEAIA